MRKTYLFAIGILMLFALYFSFPKAYADSLPPCAQWADLGGNHISESDAQTRRAEEIKCVAIDTAIGNVSTEPQGFVKYIYSVVLGLSGGIALIMIIISGYRFMVSQGNPEAVKAAGGQLTSAVVGLLFIIFAFVILQIVGVDILQIPGFGK